jgi:hypothetical protein
MKAILNEIPPVEAVANGLSPATGRYPRMAAILMYLVPKGPSPSLITEELVEIRVLRTRSFFAGDILRRFLRRVSPGKSTSAPARF